eukprot:9957142-Lingulodinium_polyedra.AAC.1
MRSFFWLETFARYSWFGPAHHDLALVVPGVPGDGSRCLSQAAVYRYVVRQRAVGGRERKPEPE